MRRRSSIWENEVSAERGRKEAGIRCLINEMQVVGSEGFGCMYETDH